MRNRTWYKIWAIGNGGMRCYEQYVYWYRENDKDEMAYRVEYHFGPMPEGIRSLHWEEEQPPKEYVELQIRELRAKRRNLLSEMKEHLASLKKK